MGDLLVPHEPTGDLLVPHEPTPTTFVPRRVRNRPWLIDESQTFIFEKSEQCFS